MGQSAKSPDFTHDSRWRIQPASVTKPENSTFRRSKVGERTKRPENSTFRRSKVGERTTGPQESG